MATVAAMTAITKAAIEVQRDSFDNSEAGPESLAAGVAASDSGKGPAGDSITSAAEDSVGDVSDIGRWYSPYLGAASGFGVKK